MKDIRNTNLYREAEKLYGLLQQPGSGRICDAAQLHVSPHGSHAVFAGTIMDELEGAPQTRICLTDLFTGDTRVMTFGPNVDRMPKFSPDGLKIAFLSDRKRAGDYQLYLLDTVDGGCRCTQPPTGGWIEYLHWSPNGLRVLLGTAGYGADISGGQGGVASRHLTDALPSWMPEVEMGDETYRWRRAWVYDLGTDSVREIDCKENIWEAVWCGDDAIAAVTSAGPGEGLWYSARLQIIDLRDGVSRIVYLPKDQLGWPAASSSGKHLAIVEALCSDRGIVAGDLLLLEPTSGKAQRVNTQGVDVTYIQWCSEQKLLAAGHKGFETVVGVFDAPSNEFTKVWSSIDITTGGRYVTISGLGESGDCVLVGESFLRAPEIAVLRNGEYQTVRSFSASYSDQVEAIGAVERIEWPAPDGLEIKGWLLRPKGHGPYPLIMSVHGGPVSHYRPFWLGRERGPLVLMLIKHGFAVFLPNARGSSGRGQSFARQILGDIGGRDTFDYLSGLDHLVDRGIADPNRLGVTGGSYGGFMTAWLITQDPRFAAAVAMAPIINQVTQYLVSNIPHFVKQFLGDHYTDPDGKYYKRSPIMYAHRVKTPTLNICGALDRCTPAVEAQQFHSALLENGTPSLLVIYPEEGHGVRKFPALIDYVARTVAWFEHYMPADTAVSDAR